MLLTVNFNDGLQIFTDEVYQHTKNVKLNVENAPYQFPLLVDISNDREGGVSVQYTEDSLPISIPDEFFVNGNYVYIWIHVENYAYLQLITIPVIRRGIPVVAPSGSSGGLNYRYDSDDENFSIVENP